MSQIQSYALGGTPPPPVSGSVDTLTANNGVAVTPTAGGDILLTGSGNILTTGTLATHHINITFTGILPIANGGTAIDSYSTNFGTLYFDGLNFETTATGAIGQALVSNGPGVAPSYQNISAAGAVTSVTAGENLNNSGTALNPILNLDRAIHLPNTNAAGTEGALYLGAVCSGNECTGGSLFLHNFGTANTFLGLSSGNLLTSGTGANIGIGPFVLSQISTGFQNVCIGAAGTASSAGGSITTGNRNIMIGAGAGAHADTALTNVFIGTDAGNAVVASSGCVAVGNGSLSLSVSGSNNTCLGVNSALNLVSGSSNLLLGASAGSAFNGAESSNIILANTGVAADATTIRIGTLATQTKNFQAGIAGKTNTGASNVVIIDATGQLATTSGGAVSLNTTGTQTTTIGNLTGTTTVNFGGGSALATYTGTTSWTPQFTANSSTTGITYTNQIGTYNRIGSLVTYTINITLSSKGANTTIVHVENFPFASGTTNSWPATIISFSGITFTGQLGAYFNGSVIDFVQISTAGALTFLNNTAFTNTSAFSISGQFLIGG